MNGSCHCGAVTIAVPGRPDYLNLCNCTLCTKVGGLWGYFPASQVTIDGATGGYVRADEPSPYLSTHFCTACGCTTHWAPVRDDMPDRMGVNMRLFDTAELQGIEVRYANNRDHSEGAPRFYREPTIFDGVGVAP